MYQRITFFDMSLYSFLPADIASFLTDAVVWGTVSKAWIKIIIIAFLMELIQRNKSLYKLLQNFGA
ncbi:hypothetical protein KAX03_01240 [Candidatus Bathyarchaeota archaeon]|nr:hypothetical protein [Candidatus Bathyarchaeota archaeon]